MVILSTSYFLHDADSGMMPAGSHPGYTWWPGSMAHPGQHPQQGGLPFQNGMYSPMGQYSSSGMYPGAPPQYPMMGVSLPGSYPGVRMQGYPGYDLQGFPAPAGAGPREWSPQPQQDTYNCEVLANCFQKVEIPKPRPLH